MRRVLIATVGLSAVAATAGSVLAAPAPADSGRSASTSFTLPLPDGDSLRLDLSAAQLSQGPSLFVDATRCDADNSCTFDAYTGALSASDLTISPNDATADLSTTLDGRALTISWRPSGNGEYLSGADVTGQDADAAGSEEIGDVAVASVSYDGSGCTGSGGVGTAITFDTGAVTGGDTRSPLSALHLPAGAQIRC